MKEASSTMWTFQMIIIFMLIFSAFLALILVYSKAFSIKNNFISIIEKYDGITKESFMILNNYAKNHSYKEKAHCAGDGTSIWYGVNIEDNTYEVADENKEYNYCFSEEHDARGLIYYNIVIFYRFNLPVLNNLGGYRINGRTNSFRVSPDKLI